MAKIRKRFFATGLGIMSKVRRRWHRGTGVGAVELEALPPTSSMASPTDQAFELAKLRRELDRVRATVAPSPHPRAGGLPVAALHETDGRHYLPIAPNRIWLADITYSATGVGWLNLTAALDLAMRKVVGGQCVNMCAPSCRGGIEDGRAAAKTRIRPDPSLGQRIAIHCRRLCRSSSLRSAQPHR